MSRTQAIIVTVGVALAAILFAWPDWIAVHPSNPSLNVPLGHAWLWSRPGPPKGFDMRVVIGTWWWFICILSLGQALMHPELDDDTTVKSYRLPPFLLPYRDQLKM